MHSNSLALFKAHVIPHLMPGWRVLEVGWRPGDEAYQDATIDADLQLNWHRCDLSNRGVGGSNIIEMMGPYSIGASDELFNAVISGQTIEHVAKPWRWVPELARVVKRGGIVALLSPISWAHHRHPLDCWRIWPDGMASLFEEAELEPELIKFDALASTEKERNCQINPGRVLDLVSIGRKPGGPPR